MLKAVNSTLSKFASSIIFLYFLSVASDLAASLSEKSSYTLDYFIIVVNSTSILIG